MFGLLVGLIIARTALYYRSTWILARAVIITKLRTTDWPTNQPTCVGSIVLVADRGRSCSGAGGAAGLWPYLWRPGRPVHREQPAGEQPHQQDDLHTGPAPHQLLGTPHTCPLWRGWRGPARRCCCCWRSRSRRTPLWWPQTRSSTLSPPAGSNVFLVSSPGLGVSSVKSLEH